jgi:dolichyl-phosphate beta-glucosyltransferase
MVLSLGPRLRVGGHPTPVRLPWSAVESLPLLRNMVPARLALFTALFAGLLLAVAVDGLWWGGGWWRRALAVATALVVLAFLAPGAPLQSRPVVATPPFFTTSAVSTLPRDGVALVVPFPQKGRANQAMLWQTEAGMWFKMPGGYFVGPGPGGAASREAPPSTTSLALDRIQRGGRPPDLTPALRRQIAQDFARWGVRSVVLGPMPHRRVMVGFLADLLGRSPERLAGVELWGDATVAATTRRS